MRLFTAVLLSDKTKSEIIGVRERLREMSSGGNFTRDENLHITLVFLGEVQSSGVGKIKAVMDGIKAQSFELEFSGFGSFGKLYWMGISENSELTSVYRQLYNELSEKGFSLEGRDYKPHITLVRELLPLPEFNKYDFSKTVPVIRERVSKVSLMKSERLGGRLVYTEIYSKEI